MSQKPNIIFIFSDQQHFRTVGGRDPLFATPHWVALAHDGVRFDTVYCTTPLCSPSRATLMTGLMPSRHGVTDNGVPLTRETIAPVLQQAGYFTTYFGKWHLRVNPAATAGWDEQRGVCDEYVPPNRPLSDKETLEATVDFLRRKPWGEKPVALFVSFDQPHGVYWAVPNGPYPRNFMAEPVVRPETKLPDSWADKPDPAISREQYVPGTQAAYWKSLDEDRAGWLRYREVYRSCVTAFDNSLGAVMAAVRAAGLYDESSIVVTSDHGDMDTAHRLVFKGPAPYEELQRVPLAIKPPKSWQAPAGRVEDKALVSLADLFPTLLETAQAKVPDNDGISLLPVVAGKCDRHWRDEVVVEYPNNTYRTVRRGDHKRTVFADGREMVFDLAMDPLELRNLAGTTP